MQTLLLFLGKSLAHEDGSGILAEAKEHFPEADEILVVARDGDTLEPPAGVETVTVSEFRPSNGRSYTVVANGGTSVQLVLTLKALVDGQAPMEVYDLQRDGLQRLW